MSDWIDNWLGQEVEFKLLGKYVRGRVIEAGPEICFGPHFVVAEFHDGPRHIKVGGNIQGFKRVRKEQ